jgi:hypothetical protein
MISFSRWFLTKQMRWRTCTHLFAQQAPSSTETSWESLWSQYPTPSFLVFARQMLLMKKILHNISNHSKKQLIQPVSLLERHNPTSTSKVRLARHNISSNTSFIKTNRRLSATQTLFNLLWQILILTCQISRTVRMRVLQSWSETSPTSIHRKCCYKP